LLRIPFSTESLTLDPTYFVARNASTYGNPRKIKIMIVNIARVTEKDERLTPSKSFHAYPNFSRLWAELDWQIR
jgi:hypothetical protein